MRHILIGIGSAVGFLSLFLLWYWFMGYVMDRWGHEVSGVVMLAIVACMFGACMAFTFGGRK